MAEQAFNVVHVSTSFNGGAGRAAFRIHSSLLQSNISSGFLSLDSEGSKPGNNCYTLKKARPGPARRVVDRIRRKLVNAGLVDRKRVKIIKTLGTLLPSLQCEIATLPFSQYDILTHPVVQSADIIHLHWVAGMIDYPRFFRNCKKPLVWTLHDMNPISGIFHYAEDQILNEVVSAEVDKEVKQIKRASFDRIKQRIKMVTPSKWLAEEVAQSTIFPPKNISTIAYSIDTSTFFSSNKASVRKELSIPGDAPVFIFAAHLLDVRRKGFDLLKEALNQIKQKFTLIAIGEMEDQDNFAQQIIYTGAIRDDNLLCKYFSSADAYILPSKEDNLPNVMLEAFACGTPVISFAVGGMKDHVIPYKTGLLATSVTAEALKETIEEFIAHKDVFDATTIHAYACQNFNPATQAELYKSLYQKLVK